MLALNIVVYAIVAGVVAFGVSYAIGFVLNDADILAGSTYTGVFVAVLVGIYAAVTAYRNSRKR